MSEEKDEECGYCGMHINPRFAGDNNCSCGSDHKPKPECAGDEPEVWFED